MRENMIGKTVWQLVQKNYSYTCDKDHTNLVIAVVEPKHRLPDGRENTDWCDHLVLQREDGTLFDVREYEVIVIPDASIKNPEERLAKFLSENQCYGELYEYNGETAIIHIDWGDWKHDHGWCNSLMGYIGYTCGDEIVTEENGSDCYSSTHYFYRDEENSAI